MKRSISIFKSFKEQEEYHLNRMLHSTPYERFKSLYKMQQWNKLFHPPQDKSRKIIIHSYLII